LETLNDFTKSLKVNEAFVDALIDRADLYALGGEYRQAYSDLSAALAIDPTNLRAYIHTGILHCHFSLYTRSIEQYDLVRRVWQIEK
jgi:tetratricopeptide (TPR) repeat protein